MNNAISLLVTIVSVGIVLGGALFGVNYIFGEWTTLLYIGIGWFAFMALMAKINAG